MFDNLRYGAGRYVLIGLLVVVAGVGGFFGYTKIMQATETTTPVTATTSTAPSPGESGSADFDSTPIADSSDAVLPDQETGIVPGPKPDDASAADKLFIQLPVPENAIQPRNVRGSAKGNEAFIYVIAEKNTIAKVAEFYLKELKAEGWDVSKIAGSNISLRMSNDTYEGVVQIRTAEDADDKVVMNGILKPKE